jgi:hypothetical protein
MNPNIKTYKHFRLKTEIFWGLDIVTIFKCLIALGLFLIFVINMNLKVDSFLFLCLGAILGVYIFYLIIKQKNSFVQEINIQDIFFFPFKNHFYPLKTTHDKEFKAVEKLNFRQLKSKTTSRHASLYKLSGYNYVDLNDSTYFNQDLDLIKVIKIDNCLDSLKIDQQNIQQVKTIWQNIIANLTQTNNTNSILGQQLKHSVQVYVDIAAYKHPACTENRKASVLDLEHIHAKWLTKTLSLQNFIPDIKYYLVIKHKNSSVRFLKLKKIIKTFNSKAEINLGAKQDYDKELEQIEDKVQTTIKLLNSLDIKSSILKKEELADFLNQYLFKSNDCNEKNITINSVAGERDLAYVGISADQEADLLYESEKLDLVPADKKTDVINIESDFKKEKAVYLKDYGTYLKYQGEYLKIYQISALPELYHSQLWLAEMIQNLKIKACFSLSFTKRDLNADRNFIQNKINFMSKLKTKLSLSNEAQLTELNELSREFLKKPDFYNLSINLKVFARTQQALTETDQKVRAALANLKLSSLYLTQSQNYATSLPMATMPASKYKLFLTEAALDTTFPLINSNLNQQSGALFGFNCKSNKPIYINEYDRSTFNNRSINFIGDSGSGKSIACKTAIKRRLLSGQSFTIIDNTTDGWDYFCRCFDGKIIDFKKPTNSDKFYFDIFTINDKNHEYLDLKISEIIKVLNIFKTVDTTEENFLYLQLKALYSSNLKPSLRSFYQLLESSQHGKVWQQALTPYVYDGMYAYLFDGEECLTAKMSALTLFNLNDLAADSKVVTIVLNLIKNYITNKVVFDKKLGHTLVLDEAWKLLAGAGTRDLINNIARTGRGMDLGLWTISQKPADLPRALHSNASVSAIFQLKENLDKREISAACNLNSKESEFLNIAELYQSGTCLLKTCHGSALTKILLDPYELAIFNSTREFVNRREEHYKEFIKDGFDVKTAARRALEKVI